MQEFSVRKILITALLVLAVIVGGTMVFKSINNIEPGNKGIVFYKLGDGLDIENVYSEGMVLIAPWNELIVYDVRQKNVDMTMKVLDKNGLEVGIDVSIVYSPMKNSIGKLHLKTGKDYENVVVIPRTRAAGREVTGQFNAEELYSTKRDQLQTNIEAILESKFEENFLIIEDVLIRDVNLPKVITLAIEAKETQNQKNDLAEKLESEATSKANALRAKGKGQKDYDVLVAEGKAEAMGLMQEQLQVGGKQYVEFIKWQGFATTGKSPYGENNIYGSGTAIVKGLK